MKLLRILALAAFLPAVALAAAPMETVQPVDGSGLALGTDTNPIVTRAPSGSVNTTIANQGAAGTQEWPVKDGTDGPGTNPGAGARGWLSGIFAKLGSPFQAGGSIGNTAFGISGTLPAYASTPTFNLGTLNGASTAANQATEIAALQAANTRALINSDFNASVPASSTQVGAIRSPGAAYTKFTVIASCAQSATLVLRASDDNFTTSSQLSSTTVTTGSYSLTNAPSSGPGMITVPNAYTSYVALLTNTNSTAGNCVIKSTATTN